MENDIRPTIAAIDDQPVILRMIVSALTALYRVVPFTSGKTAFAYFKNQTADLILLDYQMPGMSGIDIFERFQKNNKTKDIPVIFLTSSHNDGVEADVLEKGAVDYILKPIKDRVLLTRVSIQLELYRYRNHLEALVEQKTKEIKEREAAALNLLARATDMRDHSTGEHIEGTTEIIRVIVSYLANNPKPCYTLTDIEASDIIHSAKLHDLGKIAIPDNILLKPGKLTKEEFDIIKKHPVYGAKMLDECIKELSDRSFLNTARDIALYHHEKWNGKGYPFGLKEHEIPLSARITAIADVYDALVSERPYKKPFSHEKSVEIISDDSGESFDPYLVTIFLKHSNEIKSQVQRKTPIGK